MADKNPHEEDLAVAIHRAEQAVGRAMQTPGNTTRLNQARLDLAKAEARYRQCLDGRVYSVPVER